MPERAEDMHILARYLNAINTVQLYFSAKSAFLCIRVTFASLGSNEDLIHVIARNGLEMPWQQLPIRYQYMRIRIKEFNQISKSSVKTDLSTYQSNRSLKQIYSLQTR